MSTLIRPLRGLRPLPALAARVAAPPYDVLNTEEARLRAENKPHSFLHISKPEIDLPPGCDPYSDAVYQTGANNLHRLLDGRVLIRDEHSFYYVYRLKMGDHVQTGIVATGSVAAYDQNRIRKHEVTRPDQEDDRVRQIEALNAQTGPVLSFYRADAALKDLLAQVSGDEPLYNVTAEDGVVHTLWIVISKATVDQITKIVDAMPALYIADGHHRSAAASCVAAARRGKVTDTDSHEYFLTVAFPHDEMQILDYNRVVADLNGLEPAAFLQRVGGNFAITPADGQVKPDKSTRFGMYLDGRWFQLDVNPALVPKNDPVEQLDLSLLQKHLIAPILGITDPRRDKRIDFVGGIRGLGELEKRVSSGEMAVAFALHPTRLDQLMAVADAGEVMPPKSTWFEPKLADGFVSHVLD